MVDTMTDGTVTNNVSMQEPTQQTQDGLQKKDMTHITIRARFCHENVQPKNPDDKPYNYVTLPSNTFVNGVNVGGYNFYPFYINKPNKFENGELVRDAQGHPVQDENSNLRDIPYSTHKPVRLSHLDKETGQKMTIEVSPKALAAGITENYKQYKEQSKENYRNTPKVYANVNEKFVKQDVMRKDGTGSFNVVNLAKGTMIDGKDFGGYSFYPKYVNFANKFDENGELVRDSGGYPVPDETSSMRQIPLIANKPVKLSHKDQETGQKVEVEVEPAKLVSAIKEQRSQYIDNIQTQKVTAAVENQPLYEEKVVEIDEDLVPPERPQKVDFSKAKVFSQEDIQRMTDAKNAEIAKNDPAQAQNKGGISQS